MSESMKLECSLKGILRECFLMSFMKDRHWKDLHQPHVSHTKQTNNKCNLR